MNKTIVIDQNRIPSFLLGVIIMLNAVRCVFGIYESSLLVYLIYACFIVLSVFLYKDLFFIKKNDLALLFCFFLIIIVSFVTSIFLNTEVMFVKLLIIISIFIIILKMPFSNSYIVMKYTLTLGDLFVLYTVLFPSIVNNYMMEGSNYLIVTLPISLSMTLHLSKFICSYYCGNKLLDYIYNLFFLFICLYSLSHFSARSSVLFPLITGMFLILLLFINKLHKMLFVIVIFILLALFLNKIYLNNISTYGLQRMSGLFMNIWEEDRWIIWRDYLKWIMDENLYIFGAGTNASSVIFYIYPHNIILQFIGEYGLIGICLILRIYYEIYSHLKKILKKLKILDKESVILFGYIFSGMLFFLLNFMKSFSLYDAAPLFVFIGLFLNFKYKTNFSYINDKSSNKIM